MRALRFSIPAVCATLCFSSIEAAERSAHVNYVLHCSGCHGMDGSGNPGAGIPDFRNFVGAFAQDDDGRTYVLHVPGIANASLSDREISDVLNYVMQRWAGASLPASFVVFTPREVTERRARPVADVVSFRRGIVERLRSGGIRTADYPWP